MEELLSKIGPILLELAAAIGAYVLTKISTWLTKKTTETNESLKRDYAKSAVQYAEQVGASETGARKYEIAAAKLAMLLGNANIKTSEAEIEILVEQAVNELNNTTWKTEPEPEPIIEPEPEVKTEPSIIEKICTEAQYWVGYEGHKSEAKLAEFHENVGAQYNIFARRLMDSGFYTFWAQNQDWCCLGVNYCFASVLGNSATKKLLGGRYAVKYVADDTIAAGGKWVDTPQAGDLEIQGDYDHITLVTGLENGYVKTVSFNSTTRVAYGEVTNGNHIIKMKGIKGYIRPNWDLVK